ncbi:sigma 54 modulation/S30EA ribosomal C-terminal domain-containing protein [Nonomuraea sp. NPDC049400]|uniref:sigma 54 modulation/S30EA ribosomal C-terminal domain-containing protein n=1 Tax=Nonomuraea sp. NPDC049400 TaxID=3364352 RepID=UPI00378A2913
MACNFHSTVPPIRTTPVDFRRHAVVTPDPGEVQVETRGVRLSASADPAVARPCTAQANIDVSGRLIRAQGVAESIHQAIRLLGDRLRVRLRRTGRDWEDLRGRRPEDADHEWRHASPHRRPLPYFPRPVGKREVVRHKAYELAWATPGEAAFDMEQLDYDFHLFTEAEIGQDSVIYHSRDGYRLAQVEPAPYRLGPVSIPLTVSSAPAPVLSVSEAVECLEATGMPFIFFADASTGGAASSITVTTATTASSLPAGDQPGLLDAGHACCRKVCRLRRSATNSALRTPMHEQRHDRTFQKSPCYLATLTRSPR